MKYQFRDKALLLLEDGTLLEGKSIGKKGTSGGEICFNTGMTGYQEVYTDPSYFGQIMINTNSHIGNYGVTAMEVESDAPKINGVIINKFSENYSRNIASGSLQDYFEQHGVVGIEGVDTRKLVRHIRSKGAMNAIISSEILDPIALRRELERIPSMEGLELSSRVSTTQSYEIGPEDGTKVAVLDLGIKRSIIQNMVDRGLRCKVFPAKTSFDDMEIWSPEAYFISNGPGDPAAMDYAVDTVRRILEADKPIFGICLGHQILALANGIPTFKMHHGHRGLNHPVKNLLTGRSEITSQNHGFAVSKESITANDQVEVTHINLNDDSIEGFRLKNKKAFSVQYHPESSPGPHDSRYLFDDFIKLFNQ